MSSSEQGCDKQIPLGTRILAVADAFDAMITDPIGKASHGGFGSLLRHPIRSPGGGGVQKGVCGKNGGSDVNMILSE